MRSSVSASGRAAGSRTSSAVSTGVSAPARSGGGTSWLSTAASVASTVFLRSGWRPSTATYSIMPSDHRSEAGSPSTPLMRSGAMYSGEPMNAPVDVRLVDSRMAAMPKSVSTDLPSACSSTLAGLTSRWWMPTAWAARNADSTSRPIRAASAGGMGPRWTRSWSEPPVTSSMTIHG